ncbi:hypothetical protein NIES2107_25230 [Nostoc carneum NIES-2107]|nr:hypothetical protein NIES2107_25230 [Nostoc carneum NIES-2107]
MKKYHYEIVVNLTTLKPSIGDGEQLAAAIFDETEFVNLYLDTNNRLEKDELLQIRSRKGNLINLEITKITRYHVQLTEDNHLIEMDMTKTWHQDNRPINTSCEVWFTCMANALTLTQS